MRGEPRAPPPAAAALGRAAQATVRARPETLPELRRPAEDHCGDPRTAGNREEPPAPGVAGQGATKLSCSRSSAASGLTIPVHHCSGGAARSAAGVGCVRVVAGPMKAAMRQRVTRGRHPEKRFLAALSTPNRSQVSPRLPVQSPYCLAALDGKPRRLSGAARTAGSGCRSADAGSLPAALGCRSPHTERDAHQISFEDDSAGTSVIAQTLAHAATITRWWGMLLRKP